MSQTDKNFNLASTAPLWPVANRESKETTSNYRLILNYLGHPDFVALDYGNSVDPKVCWQHCVIIWDYDCANWTLEWLWSRQAVDPY